MPYSFKTFATFGAATVLTVGLSACSVNIPPNMFGGIPANETFVRGMIPHHKQAVEMSVLALSPSAKSSPQVKKIATQILKAQGPEIQEMETWSQEWMQQDAARGEHHGDNHGGHDMGGKPMPGMMTPKQMVNLEEASGENFDKLWLKMMISHHKGAIVMSEQVKAESTHNEVVGLANTIIDGQRAEIKKMRKIWNSHWNPPPVRG